MPAIALSHVAPCATAWLYLPVGVYAPGWADMVTTGGACVPPAMPASSWGRVLRLLEKAHAGSMTGGPQECSGPQSWGIVGRACVDSHALPRVRRRPGLARPNYPCRVCFVRTTRPSACARMFCSCEPARRVGRFVWFVRAKQTRVSQSAARAICPAVFRSCRLGGCVCRGWEPCGRGVYSACQ